MQPLNIYIGYDQREDLAYQVLRYSLLKNCGPEANVYRLEPIIQDWLRARRIYTRQKDVFASTDFSLTRFLTPYLNNFEGVAVFMDLDFLVTRDLVKSLKKIITEDPTKAVWVVKHSYISKTTTKMDNKVQHVYPKKNWSSFMVFNCSHPAVQTLTPSFINKAQASELHQFKWVDEADIGELPREFNYLVGEYPLIDDPLPLCLHFTLGLPFIGEMFTRDYLDVWNKYEKEYQGASWVTGQHTS